MLTINENGYVSFSIPEDTMCYDTQPRDTALDYIRNRVRDLYYEKEREISDAFADPTPNTIKEAKEWMKEGNYRYDLPKGYDDDVEAHWHYFFRWGKDAPDEKAHEDAIEALLKAKEDLRDKVTIITDEKERLAALEEFKAKKFH